MLKAFAMAFDPGDALATRPRLDPDALNLQLRFAPDSRLVGLRLRVGGVILVAALAAAYLGRHDGFIVLVAGGFGAVALVNLIHGFLQKGFEQRLSITASEVSVQRSSPLMGARGWREPLTAFRGVSLRELHARAQTIGNLQSTQTFHVVELQHPDPSRTVALYLQEGGAPPRGIQASFARRFGLPALVPEGARPVAPEPSAAQARPAVDPGPPPAGVSVVRLGERTRIVIGQTRLKRRMLGLAWWLIPLALGALVWQLDRTLAMVAAAFAFMLLAALSLAGRLVHGDREAEPPSILIDSRCVRIDRKLPEAPGLAGGIVRAMERMTAHGPFRAQASEQGLPRSAIAMVRVDAYTSHAHGSGATAPGHLLARLTIEADERQLSLAVGWTDRHKLEWTRDFLLAELARTEADPAP